jgi:hypothetical protein
MTFWPKFCLALLATWRVAHLLAHEDGPFDVIARCRAWVGSSRLGGLMDCFQCLSIWVAIPAAFFIGGTWMELIFEWLALSGGACILQQFERTPVVIHRVPAPEERSFQNAMLRTETSGGERRPVGSPAGNGAQSTREE